MREVEAAIESDRKKLEEQKDMEEGERETLAEELAKREDDLQLAK